jgi:hypothetical protein
LSFDSPESSFDFGVSFFDSQVLRVQPYCPFLVHRLLSTAQKPQPFHVGERFFNRSNLNPAIFQIDVSTVTHASRLFADEWLRKNEAQFDCESRKLIGTGDAFGARSARSSPLFAC